MTCTKHIEHDGLVTPEVDSPDDSACWATLLLVKPAVWCQPMASYNWRYAARTRLLTRRRNLPTSRVLNRAGPGNSCGAAVCPANEA